MTNRTFSGIIIVTMITRVKDRTVTMEGRLASLGREKDRWCVVLPSEVSKYLGKRTRYEITFKPLGSIGLMRVSW